MTTDRITKVLLGTIALGLWMNVVDRWIRSAHLAAADADSTVIMRDVHSIATGSCSNKHIHAGQVAAVSPSSRPVLLKMQEEP